jgi:hypothetical protein
MKLAHPITEREDARQLCSRVLAGTPASVRSLLIDVEGEDALLVFAAGAQPIAMWRLREVSDARLPPRGSIERLVVTSSGTASARNALVDALLDRFGPVAVPMAA